MFDIGFWELVIIGIIGLVVLGPERLPTAIRSVRTWVNKVKTFSNSVQTELKEELRIHELHENLKKAEQTKMEDLSPEVAESVKALKDAANMMNRPFDSQTPFENDNEIAPKPANKKSENTLND
ncbi:MAG: Sec-independent protein translocase protein TatB [Thalassotalea sp.]